jgi:hypothetical protein
MPRTAAIDNETLDHLLSVVDDSGSLRIVRELSKRRYRSQSRSFRVHSMFDRAFAIVLWGRSVRACRNVAHLPHGIHRVSFIVCRLMDCAKPAWYVNNFEPFATLTTSAESLPALPW